MGHEPLQHHRRRRERVGPPVPLAVARRGRARGRVRVLALDGLPPPLAVEGRRDRLLRPHARPDDARLPRRARQPAPVEVHGLHAEPVVHGARRERDLGDPVLVPRHARGLEPLRPPHRGGGARPRGERADHVPRGDPAARLDGDLRQLPVRLHAHLERLRPHDPAPERLRGPAAADPDRHLAAEPADPAQPLRARGRDDGGDAVPDLHGARRRHAPPSVPRRAGEPSGGGVRRGGEPRRRVAGS